MVLTIMAATHTARILSLDKLANLLPSPLRPLHGKRAAPLALPDNIICFCRRSAAAKTVAREIANSVSAMEDAIQFAIDGPLTTDVIKKIHVTLARGTDLEAFG